jgi:hypothetical protein
MAGFVSLLRRAAHRRELAWLYEPLVRVLMRRGVFTWGTKSFDFWILLMAALRLTEPRSIVELGSGRSTSYLAEYALKHGATLVSVEQSRPFARKVRRGLRSSFVPAAGVRHVPVSADGWYAGAALQAAAPLPCDCLFVDGPVGAQEELGIAERDGSRARAWLERAAAGARLLVVDDVHRPENLSLLADLLAVNAALGVRYLAYEPHPGAPNVLALAAGPDVLAALDRIAEELALDLVADRVALGAAS